MPELPGLWSLSPLAALVGALVVLYLMLASGRLVTKSSHERELKREIARGDEWRDALKASEIARASLQTQNSALLAGVRIADKFYRDFLPEAPDENTYPHLPGGRDAVV